MKFILDPRKDTGFPEMYSTENRRWGRNRWQEGIVQYEVRVTGRETMDPSLMGFGFWFRFTSMVRSFIYMSLRSQVPLWLDLHIETHRSSLDVPTSSRGSSTSDFSCHEFWLGTPRGCKTPVPLLFRRQLIEFTEKDITHVSSFVVWHNVFTCNNKELIFI